MLATAESARRNHHGRVSRYAATVCLLVFAACGSASRGYSESANVEQATPGITVERLTPEVVDMLAKAGIDAAVLAVVPPGQPLRVLYDPSRASFEEEIELKEEEAIQIGERRIPDTAFVGIWRGTGNTAICPPRPPGGGATSCRTLSSP
jgi:hypothetical protein